MDIGYKIQGYTEAPSRVALYLISYVLVLVANDWKGPGCGLDATAGKQTNPGSHQKQNFICFLQIF